MANQVKFGNTTFSVGDKIIVYQKIQEEKRVRIQPFEGTVIAIRGRGENKTFTVRKISSANIGVEKIWPINSPWVEKIKLVKSGRVRRAKLYYLRKRRGSEAIKIKEKKTFYEKGQSRKSGRKSSEEVS